MTPAGDLPRRPFQALEPSPPQACHPLLLSSRQRSAVHDRTRALLGEPDAELVFGLTAAVGADLEGFVRILEKLLTVYGYTASTVRLSALLDKVDPAWLGVPLAANPEFERIWTHMDAGDELRSKMTCGEALALWAVASINARRSDAGGGLGKEPCGGMRISSAR
jgi:hypothetical protein